MSQLRKGESSLLDEKEQETAKKPTSNREGFAEGIQYPGTLTHLVRDGANLLDPENVKQSLRSKRRRIANPGVTA